MPTKIPVDLGDLGKEIEVVEKIVDNDKVIEKPIEFIAEIRSAKEEISKKGNLMLVLSLAIYDNKFNEILVVNDYIPYSNKFKLYYIAKLLNLDVRNLYVEDFMLKGVVITLRKEQLKTNISELGEDVYMTTYKVDRYIRIPNENEVKAIMNKIPF